MSKKILVNLILTICSIFIINAQNKSYVSIYFNMNEPTSNWVSARLSGDVPVGMKNSYVATYDRLTEGEIINMIALNGYVIDKVVGIGETYSMIIMSKNISDDLGIITTIPQHTNTDKIEMYRYNMQGYIVNADEPGIQIIVYSDYSTEVKINN